MSGHVASGGFVWKDGARSLVLVSLHVEGEVVGPGEGARAHRALEGFGARVLPEVTRQLVGASEAPVAAVPRAPVRLLTCGGGKKDDKA